MREETKAYKLAQEVHGEFTKWAEDIHDVPLSPNFYMVLEKLVSFDFGSLDEAFRSSSLMTYLKRLDKMSAEVFEAMQIRSRYRPSIDFFQSLHRVTEEIFRWPDNYKNEIKVEPIGDLLKQGLSYDQIGLKYGMINPASGEGDGDSIRKEHESPGSVMGADWKYGPELQRKFLRRQVESWLNADAAELESSAASVEPEKIDIESIKTLAEAYAAKLSIGAASDLLNLPVIQVQEFYNREDDAESDNSQDEDGDDPPWAIGMSFESLCLKAQEMGIVTRKNMKRSTVIQRIEEAAGNDATAQDAAV